MSSSSRTGRQELRAVSGPVPQQPTGRVGQLQPQAPNIRQVHGDDTGLKSSLVVNPWVMVRHNPEIARQAHSDRTGLPPSQEVHTQVRVQISRVHGQGAGDQHPHSMA